MFYDISLSIGVILLAISFFILKDSLDFLKKSERAVGIVTQIEAVDGSEGITYKPVFTFKTHANHEVIYRHQVSSSPASWDIGEPAMILYDPKDPSRARLLSYFGVSPGQLCSWPFPCR